MKKTFLAIARPICRFIASALWQLVWLVPVWCVCWYGKITLPQMIRGHFGVDQAQDRLASLEHLAEVMKANTSLTNPTALMHYLSAQLSRFSISTKLSTLEMTSNVLQTICIWGLNLIWVAALIYAVIRTFKTYKSKTETYDTAAAVVRHLQPQLLLMQQQIMALRDEVHELKQTHRLITTDKKHSKTPLLPNE